MTNTQHAWYKKASLGILCSVLCCLIVTSTAVKAQTPPDTPTPSPPIIKTKKIEAKKTDVKPTAVAEPVITAAPVAEFSLEQKLLIENAKKLDSLNRELLVRNQQLQLTNEKLSLQVEMLKHDRYSEGTRDTLVTILLGILVGWFLSKTKKRSRYREF
jgi:hypothetical protein